jgi:hypothetical protein
MLRLFNFEYIWDYKYPFKNEGYTNQIRKKITKSGKYF